MDDSTDWVVRAVAARDRAATREYSFFEWQDYCTDHGLYIVYLDMPPRFRAFLMGDTIVLRRGMRPVEAAWYAWEEIGHHATSVGNREFWRTRPQGDITLRKMEKRARDYRRYRPQWTREE